jgi:hypothetical protein
MSFVTKELADKIEKERELEQLTQKIIKAVPSIVEIKFGCEIKLKDNPFDEQIASEFTKYLSIKNEVQKIIEVKDVSHLEGTSGKWIKTNVSTDYIDIAWYKILGRPILLEDVLIACSKQDIPILIDQDGLFQTIKSNYETQKEMVHTFRWLLNTPLHLQSEETISELNKLIR